MAATLFSVIQNEIMWIAFIITLVLLVFVMGIAGGKHEVKKEKGEENVPYMNAHSKTILQIEFPRRKQILEESIQLIQETGSLETLLSRYDTALEHANWIIQQRAKGLPIYFDTEEGGFENSLNRINNYHIIRIAMEKFINYKAKMYGLKTAKAKQNNTAQMFEFIEKCEQSLKEHSNKSESRAKLKRLYDNTEDFYSDNASLTGKNLTVK